MGRNGLFLIAAVWANGIGCAQPAAVAEHPPSHSPHQEEASGATSGASPEPGREALPLPGPEYLEIAVPGHRDAVVSMPADESAPRPVLLAAHGAGDGPIWQCQVWRGIVRARGFVLCPRGTPMGWMSGDDPGYFFRDHHALEREVLAALEALRAAFGGRVAPGPVVYAGYSQGGVMGALMLVKHPATFSRVILVEGGEREWDVPTAIKFREGGGERVLLVCGRAVCNEGARKSVWWLQRGQVEVRHESVPGGGHTYGGAVGQRLADTFGWVVRDDPRWGTW